MVLCTSLILHVVPMMLYRLAYCELLFLSLVGLTMCGCNQILQVCARRLIGGGKFLIVWAILDWLFPAVVIFPKIWGGGLYLRCIVPLWRGLWKSVWIYLHCFPVNTWREKRVLYYHGCHCHFKAVDASFYIQCNHGLIRRPFKYLVNSVKSHIISLSLIFFIAVVKVIYIHDVYLFIYSAGCDGEASA